MHNYYVYYWLLFCPTDEMSKSMAAYWRGKALNVLVDYCPEAEQLLSQAVKRHPSLVDAWNCLGECYWKSGKLDQAQHCFTGAVNRVSCVISY